MPMNASYMFLSGSITKQIYNDNVFFVFLAFISRSIRSFLWKNKQQKKLDSFHIWNLAHSNVFSKMTLRRDFLDMTNFEISLDISL